jgi:hypothetical protein
MRLAFQSLGRVETKSTAEMLSMHQIRLQDRKVTALLEVGQDDRRFLILYAHGVLAGAYHDHGETCTSIPISRIADQWRGSSESIRVVTLPDLAGRLAWLACESETRSSLRGANKAAWERMLQTWNTEKAEGLVELSADFIHGFLLLRAGSSVAGESIILHGDTHTTTDFEPADPDTSWEAAWYPIDASKPAAQALAMRHAAQKWSRAIFESYRNIAGQRFLDVLIHEMKTQINPWKWNIRVESGGIQDGHFFPSPDATAHAYRAIWMGLGAQMSFAVGGFLTQRVLSEKFAELAENERKAMESHRLIPEAFSA